MERSVKVLIIISIIVVIAAIISFDIIDVSKIRSDIDVVFTNMTYSHNCAKNFDKWQTLQESDKTITSMSNKTMKYSLEKYNELMENRCFITVKSWAHESDYEHVIWASNWKERSYENQIYLGEISDNADTLMDSES